MSYDAMQQRTASSGTELYSGNDELALAPARTFQQAAAEFDAFLAATFPRPRSILQQCRLPAAQ